MDENFKALVSLKSTLDDVDAADVDGIDAAVASAIAADGTGAVAQFDVARGAGGVKEELDICIAWLSQLALASPNPEGAP